MADKRITKENIEFYADDGSVGESYPNINAFLFALDQELMKIESENAIDVTPKSRRTIFLLSKNDPK